MQTRNREIKFISEKIKRVNAKCKRSKHIMKKAHELSVLCGVKVNVTFLDTKINKVVEFATDSRVSLVKIAQSVRGKNVSPFEFLQFMSKPFSMNILATSAKFC